jgi:hypothetical protein
LAPDAGRALTPAAPRAAAPRVCTPTQGCVTSIVNTTVQVRPAPAAAPLLRVGHLHYARPTPTLGVARRASPSSATPTRTQFPKKMPPPLPPCDPAAYAVADARGWRSLRCVAAVPDHRGPHQQRLQVWHAALRVQRAPGAARFAPRAAPRATAQRAGLLPAPAAPPAAVFRPARCSCGVAQGARPPALDRAHPESPRPLSPPCVPKPTAPTVDHRLPRRPERSQVWPHRNRHHCQDRRGPPSADGRRAQVRGGQDWWGLGVRHGRRQPEGKQKPRPERVWIVTRGPRAPSTRSCTVTLTVTDSGSPRQSTSVITYLSSEWMGRWIKEGSGGSKRAHGGEGERASASGPAAGKPESGRRRLRGEASWLVSKGNRYL